MFYKRKTQDVDSSTGLGRVYILEFTLENGKVIYKIGMTRTPRSADRMMELLRSWFMTYRYIPHTRCKLDHETGVPLLLEKHLHQLLAEWKWVPDKKVDGGQEMFTNIDVGEVIDYIKNFDYKILLNTTKSILTVDFDYIKSKMSDSDILDLDGDIDF